MRLRPALVVLTALAIGPPAYAADACDHWVKDVLADGTAKGWSHVELNAEQRANLVANYNAIPPVSTDHPDHVWVSRHDDLSVLIVIFDEGGCATEFGQVTPEELAHMLLSPGKAS